MNAAGKSLFAMACVLMTVSCAGTYQWRKPGTSDGDRQRDQSQCRRLARVEAERRFGNLALDARAPDFGGGRTLESNMAVYEAERHEKSLFEGCLKGRGYDKAKAE